MTAWMASVDPGLTEAAGIALARALDGRPLVAAERFCSSMRTLYAGPGPLTVARPALAIGCYPGCTPSWHPRTAPASGAPPSGTPGWSTWSRRRRGCSPSRRARR
ncbi:hypothetical protein ACIA9I_38205 [Streptomyces anulatus]